MAHFQIRIKGDEALIMHSAAGLDKTSDINREITKITDRSGKNRTDVDDLLLKRLECQRSFWIEEERPSVPAEALRSCIETAARKLKQGPMVREGLIVQDTKFEFDRDRYGDTMEEWNMKCQFTVPVVVQRSRVMRTRAKFEQPWLVEATLYGDDELVDVQKLTTWLDIAGLRIGLGDWRPEKSGKYGRFSVENVELVDG